MVDCRLAAELLRRGRSGWFARRRTLPTEWGCAALFEVDLEALAVDLDGKVAFDDFLVLVAFVVGFGDRAPRSGASSMRVRSRCSSRYFVVWLPSRNASSVSIRRWNGMTVRSPSMSNSASARLARSVHSSRSPP